MGEVITDVGLNQLAKLFCGEDNNFFAYIALGIGTSEPDPSDTALEHEILRKQADVTVEGNKVTFKIVVNPGELNANVTEIGLFNAESGGEMYYRKVSPQGIYFDENTGASIYIECEFSR